MWPYTLCAHPSVGNAARIEIERARLGEHRCGARARERPAGACGGDVEQRSAGGVQRVSGRVE
jgi:hypothetical protein